MGITRRTRREIAAEAVEWFLLLQETPVAEPDRQGFSEWLLRSPAHVEEYLRVSSAWSLVDIGAEGELEASALVAAAKAHHETDNVVVLPGRLRRRTPPSGNQAVRVFSARKLWLGLTAASLAGLALWVTSLSGQSTMAFQTVVGQQSSFTLPDGSIVFLNTDSKVLVSWLPAERRIELIRGEARFKVARDPSRPFTVATTTAAVRDLGTVFNVRADSLTTQVAVLEGQVEVTVAPHAVSAAAARAGADAMPSWARSPAIERVRLGAGERAAVTPTGIQTNTGPPIEAVVAWTERRLVFRDQPLSLVIQEFNRYRTHPLVLETEGLGALRISGVFDLSDPESLIVYLGTYEAVQVDRRGDGSQHLFRGRLDQ
jgi:transmembrane sensor